MTRTFTTPRRPAPAADGGPAEQRFLFPDVSWGFYDEVLRAVDDRRVFVTYLRGVLEVMTPSYEHDAYAELAASLVRACARELRIPHRGGGSPTLRRRLADAGLEPDRCFYIRHVRAIVGRREPDPAVDPPPDLAIEVEISRRLAGRIAVYEALGVPELWRSDRRRVRMFHLGPGARYEQRDTSAALPGLPARQVYRLLQTGWEMEELEWEQAVRAWVAAHLTAPPKRRRGRQASSFPGRTQTTP